MPDKKTQSVSIQELVPAEPISDIGKPIPDEIMKPEVISEEAADSEDAEIIPKQVEPEYIKKLQAES